MKSAMFVAFCASFQSTPPNGALTSSGKPLPLPVRGWSRADTLCSVTHQVLVRDGKTHFGSKWTRVCVSEQGGGTILTPLSGHTLKAGLTAPQGVRPQAEPSETWQGARGFPASRRLWFQTEWRGPKQKALHTRVQLFGVLQSLDTCESLFVHL